MLTPSQRSMVLLTMCLAGGIRLSAQATPPGSYIPPPEQQAPTHPRIVEVPLLDCDGLPCINMSTASGKTLRLLIDMAEANSYLDTKAAQSLGVTTQGIKTDANTEVSQVQQTVVPGAKIGDLPMGDFPFMVIDTTPQSNELNKNPPPFPADGALTFRAFQQRLLEIDYGHHVIRLSEPLDGPATCPQTCTELVPRHVGNYGPVTITTSGFSINGQPVIAQIDTMFKGTILIYPDAVNKLDLKKLAKAKKKELFPFLQGGVKLAEAEGATEAFGSIELGQDRPVYFFASDDRPGALAYDATVGNGLLSQATAVFDFKGMKFWLVH